MRTSLSLVALCSFMIGNVYAQPNSKTNISDLEEQENNKPTFKISERRILKKPVEDDSESSFSMEELRVGAQRIPDAAEIQYYKSQCRYAFMSERDVIENRCETKKVSRPR